MILPARIRPDLLASTSEGRYAMHHVLLALRDGVPYLEATDGRVLGRWRLELEEGEQWLLDDFDEEVDSMLLDRVALGKGLRLGGESGEHRLRFVQEGLDAVWRPGTRREVDVIVRASTGREKAVSRVAMRRTAGDWPKTDEVLRSARERAAASAPVHADPRLLARMGQAIGDDSPVEVRFGGPKHPIRFASEAFEGLVMPITLEV